VLVETILSALLHLETLISFATLVSSVRHQKQVSTKEWLKESKQWDPRSMSTVPVATAAADAGAEVVAVPVTASLSSVLFDVVSFLSCFDFVVGPFSSLNLFHFALLLPRSSLTKVHVYRMSDGKSEAKG